MSWKPTGKPFPLKPQGTASAGNPRYPTGRVSRATRCISSAARSAFTGTDIGHLGRRVLADRRVENIDFPENPLDELHHLGFAHALSFEIADGRDQQPALELSPDSSE